MRCVRCKKGIDKKERFVLFRTFDKGKTLGNERLHWQCWMDGFNEAVQKRLDGLQKKATELLLPMAKDMIKQINSQSS